MTPSHVAAIAALTAMIREIGAWPAIVVLAVFFLSPWLVMLYVARATEKRHAAAVKMYEDNVILVQDYAEASKRWEKISESLLSVVSLNTQTHTRLRDSIRSNEFCPMVREKGPNRS